MFSPNPPVRPKRRSTSPVSLTDLIDGRLTELVPAYPAGALVLALSGGLDSQVLLAALVRLRKRRRFALRVIHVNHHLQRDADRWAAAVRQHCKALAVPVRVRHAQIALRRGDSLEAEARKARYALLAKEMRPGEVLLTAQHREDQLETVLLQLTRGAGVDGLAAMPAGMPFGKGNLVRPLLEVGRAALLQTARQWHIDWIEDPSNADLRFDRNYLRHEVLPRLQARWPSLASTAARSVSLLAEARAAVAALADLDLAQVRRGRSLELAKMQKLSLARQAAVARTWLRELGLALPDSTHLQRIVVELPGARLDAQPNVSYGGVIVRRFQGALWADKPGRARATKGAGKEIDWRWQQAAKSATGLSLRAAATGSIARSALPRVLQVRWRQGGEKLRPTANGQRRPLKDLMREAAIPPWLRNEIPLVFADNELLAVGDLWVNCDHPAVKAAGGRRLMLRWQGGLAILPHGNSANPVSAYLRLTSKRKISSPSSTPRCSSMPSRKLLR